VRACVIFNPAARGLKAHKHLATLHLLDPAPRLMPTSGPGSATLLAQQAVVEDYPTIIVAGGDGTLNEVVNGILSMPTASTKVRLGILPMGTMNVFARELGIPPKIKTAWQIILAGAEKQIDVGKVEFLHSNRAARYFVQMAGIGLDARAIELVNLRLKQYVGPLAYIVALIKAMREPHPEIKATLENSHYTAQFVLIGNGQRYGGSYRVFPEANLTDGQLDLCLFHRVNFYWVLVSGLKLLLTGKVGRNNVTRVKTNTLYITSNIRVPVQVDGEAAGELPVRISVIPRMLRVLVPPSH